MRLGTRWWLAVAVVVILSASALDQPGASAPAAPARSEPPSRREFMRQKLEFSKLLIEGLTVENYDLLARNAQALKKLSTAAQWEVPTIPNATQYITATGEFQRLCDDLEKSAREKNLDGATLAYIRLTMSCVNCHKYVRFATH